MLKTLETSNFCFIIGGLALVSEILRGGLALVYKSFVGRRPQLPQLPCAVSVVVVQMALASRGRG